MSFFLVFILKNLNFDHRLIQKLLTHPLFALTFSSSGPRTAATLSQMASAAAAVVLPSMFPECKVCESCAGGQYGNLANLANHQAGGALQYHQARRFSPCACVALFFTTWAWSFPKVIFWVMLHPKVLTKSAHLRLIDD